MGYRQLRLCSGGGGFEALPDPGPPLDLARVRAELEWEGVSVVDARVMLIVGTDPEVTVSRSGRLLFKTSDATRAQRALERLLPLLEGSVRRGAPPSRVRSR
jgi:hypothetical protein